MNMLEIFIPTKRNNYHAYLLRTPALVLFIIVAFLLNSVVGVLPVRSVAAQVLPATLLDLHNQERANAGLPPLQLNANLTNSAQRKAIAMLESDCWSHYCPDGKSPWDFFVDSGYSYYYAGENLAEGFFDNSQAMVAWMNSPTHRENILRADFEDVGFGIVQGDFQNIPNNLIIVVHFATPQPAFRQASTDIEATDLELPTPVVTSPTEGSVLNTSDVDVSGNAPGASLVNVYDHGTQLGTSSAAEGIFTYRAQNLVDGPHAVNVVSEIGVRQSSPSTVVSFRVDTRADTIEISQMLVTANTNTDLVVQVNAPDLKYLSVMIAGHTYNFTAMADTIWEGRIPISDLQSTDMFLVTNSDLGLHVWAGELPAQPLLEQAELIPGFATNITGVSAGWDFSISRAGINAAFLIGMCVLFGLDFTILSKTGLTSQNRSRTHLHFAVIIVVLLVTLGSSLTGSVGSGGLVSY